MKKEFSEENFKKLFGENLKKLRKEKGLSQEALAERVEIETYNISRIETGKSFPQINNLIKIINLLEVEPVELFNFTHFNSNFELRLSINKLLDENPQNIETIYKIITALCK